MKLSTLALLILAGSTPLTACGGGGGGGGGGTADVLIGDAPRDDLLTFSAVVQSVRLQREDLSFTGDLLGSREFEVEFLGLNGALAFLVKGKISAGTYVAVEIGFKPGAYLAKADDSSPVTIVAASDTYLAPLPAPLMVATGDYVRFAVDLDLLNSLTGDVGTGSIDFGPEGSCDSNDGSEDALIDELKGTVVSSSLATGRVVVDGFVGEPPVTVGRVGVHVGITTVLLDNDNAALSLEAFFASIPGGTLLEVHGNLAVGGVVEATRIEIEDAGGGGASVARIAGVVTNIAGGQFGLQIAQIKDGAAVVQPVLQGLGNPAAIDVSFGGGTTFVFDSGGLTNSGSLGVGQEVKVRFSAFVSEPFPASEVEIDDSPGFHATLTGLERLPAELVVRLDADDPAIRGGSVAGPDTEVRVVLAGAPLLLDVPGVPTLALGELQLGLELEPHGRLSGSPDAPVITAERVLVRPGLLRRTLLQDVAAGGGNLVVDGGELVDSFGLGVTPGPLLIWIEPGCVFEGAARSAGDFQALFGGRVATGAALDVRGIGNGVKNEIRAFAIRAQQL